MAVKPEKIQKLSKVEEFYVQNNLSKTDVELSKIIGQPVETIQKYRNGSRIRKLLIQDKGCTIMTEAASMAGDEARKHNISSNSPMDYIHYLKSKN